MKKHILKIAIALVAILALGGYFFPKYAPIFGGRTAVVTSFDSISALNALISPESVASSSEAISFSTVAGINTLLTGESVASSSDIISFSTVAEINAFLSGETVASSTSSNANFVNDAGYLVNTDINTYSKLNTIVADETLVYAGGALGTPSSGTLTNATGLPYSGLADGTDGELITWDSAGTAATVAAGTAAQVLTSNGAGAAPTFQDAGGGGVNCSVGTVSYSSAGTKTIAHGLGATPGYVSFTTFGIGAGTNGNGNSSTCSATTISNEVCAFETAQRTNSNVNSGSIIYLEDSGSPAAWRFFASLTGLDSTNITINVGTRGSAQTAKVIWEACE